MQKWEVNVTITVEAQTAQEAENKVAGILSDIPAPEQIVCFELEKWIAERDAK